jgi:hypothetical protein
MKPELKPEFLIICKLVRSITPLTEVLSINVILQYLVKNLHCTTSSITVSCFKTEPMLPIEQSVYNSLRYTTVNSF